MIYKDIFTAITLGFIGGLIPGPVIFLAFSEILKSPKKGFSNGAMYIFVAGLTEFLIGLFLIITSSWLKIPDIIFHILSIFGFIILAYIAFQLFKIKKIDLQEQKRKIKPKHIFLLMLFNGPLWLYWLSVCLPIAFHLGSQIKFGEYLFIIIFEVSMVIALSAVVLSFNSLSKYFLNEKVIGRSFMLLSLALVFVAFKILYSELNYFINLLF